MLEGPATGMHCPYLPLEHCAERICRLGVLVLSSARSRILCSSCPHCTAERTQQSLLHSSLLGDMRWQLQAEQRVA